MQRGLHLIANDWIINPGADGILRALEALPKS
jgi:hypothetical protein